MTQPTQIFLVRHAETTMIQDNRIHGHLDAPLSEKGLRDAHKTADSLRGQHFDALYTSSLGRALTTARIIGEAIDLQPIALDGLKERYYGWLEGQSLKWFEPALTGAWLNRILSQAALAISGESDQRFTHRILKTFHTISDQHRAQRVLIVVHWGILSILTKLFRGESMQNWQAVGPWTACGITEAHLNGNGWHIIRLDDGSHL